MNVNITNYVKRLKHISFLDPVVEAVANSLHAKAKIIRLYVEYQRLTDNKDYIKKITILDNGEGFHVKNQDSFNTFMSDYKIHLGGRGVGRFCYLKVFHFVNYESVFKDNDMFYNVKFKFDEKFSEKDFIKKVAQDTKSFTKLELFNINQKYDNKTHTAKSTNDIKQYLMEKLLVEFSLNDFLKIEITSDISEKSTIFKTDIPSFDEYSFTIEHEPPSGSLDQRIIKKDFNVKYYFEKGIKTQSYFCTERRIVKETGIKINLINDNGAVFLVSSKYLDKYVNDFRTSYDFPKDCIIPMPRIENELKISLSKLIEKKFPKICESNENVISEVKNKYPYLKKYISTEGQVGAVDRCDIVTKALKSQRKAKENNISTYETFHAKYHKMLQEHKIDTGLIHDFVKHIEDTNELNKENLVEFIWYSNTILDFLIDAVTNKVTDEETIHNIIIKKKDNYFGSNDIVQTERNNMWIFGHQFMGYDYIASDKKIKEILGALDIEIVKDTYGAEKQPDIFQVMPKNNLNEISDIVIFELKKMNTSLFEKTKGIDQIKTYASALLKNITTVSMIWGYLLIDFDAEIESYLKEEEFHKSYTENGKAYLKYNENRRLILTVLDMKALLSMAKARNETFINILEDNKSALSCSKQDA